jgi:hypothetical protein
MSPAVALASLLLAGPAPDTSVPPVEWLTDTDGVIEMLLAHRKKLLTWTGAPNEIGCKRHFEVAFSDVKRVEADRVEAGFILELQAGKPRSWVLTPLPHVEHLLKGPAVHEGDLQHKANSLGLVDRDGAPLRMGGRAGGVGPDVRKREVPEQVQRDMDRAIRTLRDALGSPQG